MLKKIVAIGGGENGRIQMDGTSKPYETREIDTEIVRLTGKSNPNFLFLAHSQLKSEYELSYFETMKKIYGDIFKCNCKMITKEELINNINVEKKIHWADIIYEGGGDTLGMIELWRKTGFDKILYEAWQAGKIMCGVSAGANAWFSSCSSDSLKIQNNDMCAPMINVECLGFINLFFTPHCNIKDEYTNRLEHMKQSLKGLDLIGIGLSNCCALEVIDDEYRLITSDASNYNIKPYGVKCYWINDKYIEENINQESDLKPLQKLLTK